MGKLLSCVACGNSYVIQDNIPILIDSKEHSSEGFDYLTHYERDSEQFDYFEDRTGATAHSERRLREFILSLVPKQTKSILDVGCGSAWVAKAFQNTDSFVCSLDVSAKNPRIAMDRYPSPNHVGIAADTYHLPFADHSFDTIVASEIIEHLHDPIAFAKELTRVVKHGGAIIVSTPCKERLVYELCVHCHELTPRNAHLHSWDEPKLHAIFSESVGWEFMTFNNKLLLFARTYPLLQWMPFGLWKNVDALANFLVNRPVNCVMRIGK